MKRGFTIIEILIAMILLFTAIGFVNIAIKAFNNYQRKSETYQNFYITALSLKDWISLQSFDNKEKINGTLNGINYSFKIKELKRDRNYTFSIARSGNYGDFFIILYKIQMQLVQKNRIKNYTFFLTKQKRIKPFVEEGI